MRSSRLAPPRAVPQTCADVTPLQEAVGFAPHTPIEQGVARFVEWYRDYREKSG